MSAAPSSGHALKPQFSREKCNICGKMEGSACEPQAEQAPRSAGSGEGRSFRTFAVAAMGEAGSRSPYVAAPRRKNVRRAGLLTEPRPSSVVENDAARKERQMNDPLSALGEAPEVRAMEGEVLIMESVSVSPGSPRQPWRLQSI